MVQDITPYFQQLLLAVIVAVFGVIGVYVRVAGKSIEKYIESKIGAENKNALVSFIRMSVRFVEQSKAFSKFDGAAKKEYVVTTAAKFAQENNIPADSDFIDKATEEAVHVMNTEVGKYDWGKDALNDDELKSYIVKSALSLASASGVQIPGDIMSLIIDNAFDMIVDGK